MLRPLGTTSLLISPLCLGGNVFGWTADEAESIAVLDAYTDKGGNFIDTADTYSSWVPGHEGGESEAIIGTWLQRRGRRDDVVIATKVAKCPGHRGLAATNIKEQCDASLRRLQTDYIDVYYAHEVDPAVPIEESLAAFDELVRAGKVRHIAASNFSTESLATALRASRANGYAALEVVQPHYNLLYRNEFEGAMRDLCAAENIACVSYFGLARGFLTGKYREGVEVDSARASGATMYQNDRGWRTLRAMDEIAAARATTLPAIALAWVAQQPGVAAPIASARTLDQLVALLPMTDLVLTADELNALETAAA
jgi:aryl-alcohol dehydrogenase-like predicted oxidoreductase